MTLRAFTQTPEQDAEVLRESFDGGLEWTREEARSAFGWNDRRFRLAVALLRSTGYPVVAESGAGSVYRKARTNAELDAFIERELVSRSRQIEQQIRALREAASRHFGSDQLHIAI